MTLNLNFVSLFHIELGKGFVVFILRHGEAWPVVFHQNRRDSIKALEIPPNIVSINDYKKCWTLTYLNVKRRSQRRFDRKPSVILGLNLTKKRQLLSKVHICVCA